MSNHAESMMQDQIEGAQSENAALRSEIERLRMELENTRAEAVLAVKAAQAAERERYDELFAAYNEVCAISSRRAAAVDAIVSHWREFGPEHGLDEVVEREAAVVGRA